MKYDEDIWGSVANHTWKWRQRGAPPQLVELHSTRSGVVGRSAAREYGSTKNWFLSPNNKVQGRTEVYGSMASVIIGGGRVCRVLPEDVYPHYSLGHADPLAFSIELGQSLVNTPFEPADLVLAAQQCAEWSTRYNIPVRVLPWLSSDNHEAPGYVRHDRSAQGRQAGKTDPGPLFDDRAFEGLVNLARGGDYMSTSDYTEVKNWVEGILRLLVAEDVKVKQRLDWVEGLLRILFPRVDALIEAVQAARKTLEEHLVPHDTSGDSPNRYAGQYLRTMANLLDKIEAEMRTLAALAEGA